MLFSCKSPLATKFDTGKLMVSQEPSPMIPSIDNSPECIDCVVSTFNLKPSDKFSKPLFVILISKDSVPSE